MKNLKINSFLFFHFLPQFSTASLFLFSLFVEHLNQDNLKLQSELFSSEKPQNSNKEEIDDEKLVQLQEENTELHGLITSLRLREERVNADKKDCEDVLKLNEMLNKSLETKNTKKVIFDEAVTRLHPPQAQGPLPCSRSVLNE